MNDNTILRIKVPAHLYESVKEQLTLKENKKQLQEEISASDEELMAFYEKVKQEVESGTDLESAIHYAKFDINNPDAAKELSSMNEAKKQNFGAGWSVVKEKKAPKDGMKKVEEANTEIKQENTEMEKKTRSLEELKKAKKALDKKIEEMSSADKVEEGVLDESAVVDIVNWIAQHGKDAIDALKNADPETLQYLAGVAGITGLGAGIGTHLNKKEKETGKSQLPMTNKSRGITEAKESVNEARDADGREFPELDDFKFAIKKIIQSPDTSRILKNTVMKYLADRKFSGVRNMKSERLYDQAINDLLQN